MIKQIKKIACIKATYIKIQKLPFVPAPLQATQLNNKQIYL